MGGTRRTEGGAAPPILCIATQHLDVAYLWERSPAGELLAHDCFAAVAALLDAHPRSGFVFSRSTAWSFSVLQARWPDLFARVAAHVAAGRIECAGGQWVEPDTVLPRGETLVRQCLYGQRYFLRTFGILSSVGWNPDVFGHPGVLPQILSSSGMAAYYVHRCLPPGPQGRPLTQFRWRGIDGTEILVFGGKWRGRPDGKLLAECVETMGTSGLPMDFIATGANSDRRVTLESDWPQTVNGLNALGLYPAAKWATAAEVASTMEGYRELLPVVTGDLDLQFTGTYTSEGNIKGANRRIECLLLDCEKAATLAYLASASAGVETPAYPADELDSLWKHLCVNNFHDIICGTCYQRVHEEAFDLYRSIESGARELLRRSLTRLLGAEVDVFDGRKAPATVARGEAMTAHLVNLLPWERRAALVLDAGAAGDLAVFADRASDCIRSQVVRRADGGYDILFVTPEVPALGSRTLHLRRAPGGGRTSVPRAGDHLVLRNRQLEAEVDPTTGALVQLTNVTTGTLLIGGGGLGNRLVLYGDRTRHRGYEPWYIGYTGERRDLTVRRPPTLLEAGPVRWRIGFSLEAVLRDGGPPTVVEQDIILYDELPYLIFETRGCWNAEAFLLRSEFDLAFPFTSVASEMPYGVTELRAGEGIGGTDSHVGEDAAVEDGLRLGERIEEPDRPMHTWVDAFGAEEGLAVLNDGKYGFCLQGRRLGISLLRSPIHRDGIPVGLGPFAFSYALLPHRGDWRLASLHRCGRDFNHPLWVAWPRGPSDGAAAGEQPFTVDATPNVILEAVKKAEDGDGVLLRFFECSGQPGLASVDFARPVTRAVSCDLLERPLPSGRTSARGTRKVDTPLRPFEIATVLVELG